VERYTATARVYVTCPVCHESFSGIHAHGAAEAIAVIVARLAEYRDFGYYARGPIGALEAIRDYQQPSHP
jgi:hypothetical protein